MKAIDIILHYGDKDALEKIRKDIPRFGPFFYIEDELESAEAIVNGNEDVQLVTDSEALLLTVQQAIRKGRLKKEQVTLLYHVGGEDPNVKELRLDDEGELLDLFPDIGRYHWRMSLVLR